MLNQTIQPNELLFIFDGWDDDKIKKLILFYFPDAKLISLSENRGQGSARNIGVKESNADLIAFVDQDDFWDPEHLGDLILGFSIGKFVFGYSDIAEVNEDGKVSISSMMHQAELLGNNKVIKSNIQDLLFKDLMIFPSSSMVRRDAFLEVGGFLENIRGHEDDFLFRKLIEKYEAHFYVNLRSSYWTNHSKGTSGSAAMSISRLQYAEILFKEFEKDDVLKRGIFIRLANSFVREITSLSKVSRFEDQEFSNINFYKLMRLAKIHDVAVPIRFRIFNLVKNYRMQKASIKIYKKVRSFATK
jgi:glycosyltransferase involved in cell wall biosynthesis